MIKSLSLCAAASLLFPLAQSSLAATTPPTAATALTSYIDSKQQEQRTLLEQLVNINSGTENKEGIIKVGNIMEKELRALGFDTQWHELPPDMKHAGSLIATHHGGASKHVLLIAHLDTVFSSDSPFQKFEPQAGGETVKGPGVIDDKGGLVTLLYALKALDYEGTLKDMNISVVLVGDEELAGKPTSISRKALIDIAKQSDIALGFEFSLSPDELVTSRRGLSEWFLTSTASGQHSSVIFKEGFGAIYETSRVLDEIRKELSTTTGLSINPGIILGGSSAQEDIEKGNGTAAGRKTSVATTTIVHGDLRFSDDAQKTFAERSLQHIASTPLAQAQSHFEFRDIMPTMQDSPANQALLKQFSDINMTLNGKPLTSIADAKRGGADISYTCHLVTACIDGLGPWGKGPHTQNETLELKSLPVVTKRSALFLSDYAHSK